MSTQITLRLPDELLADVDAYVRAKNAETPGLGLTRVDAIRILTTAGVRSAIGARLLQTREVVVAVIKPGLAKTADPEQLHDFATAAVLVGNTSMVTLHPDGAAPEHLDDGDIVVENKDGEHTVRVVGRPLAGVRSDLDVSEAADAVMDVLDPDWRVRRRAAEQQGEAEADEDDEDDDRE